MGVRDRYGSPAAFRAALEQRLRHEARESGVALYRLRKEAVFHRLLLRLRQVAPDGWAVKGGFALILRLGAQVRATKDIDANWRADRDALEATLSAVEEIDGGDWFAIVVSTGQRSSHVAPHRGSDERVRQGAPAHGRSARVVGSERRADPSPRRRPVARPAKF